MYNNLYNSPLAVDISTPWFNGAEQGSCLGRGCIITSKGVYYAAFHVGEDRVAVRRSTDNGYTWELMHIFQEMVHCTGSDGDGGICLYLDYSEVDEILYIIYLAYPTTGEYTANLIPYLYDVTNETGIGFIGEDTFNCAVGRFACAGYIDRKLYIVWTDAGDAFTVKGTLVDINHYRGVPNSRWMTLEPWNGTVDTGSSSGNSETGIGPLYDVSELNADFIIWWVSNTNGHLYSKEINVQNDDEDFTANANVDEHSPAGAHVITELFACYGHCMITCVDAATPANSRLYLRQRGTRTDSITPIEGAAALAEDCGGTYDQYAWPQMLVVKSGSTKYLQVFYMARNNGDSANQLETVEMHAGNGAQGTSKIVTGSLATPWSLRDKCFCIFEAPNITDLELNCRGNILVAIGNGYAEGFGHRSDKSSIYTEWLLNNAYPITYTSTIITQSPADYYTAGNINRYNKNYERFFELKGIDLLILKYELCTDPQIHTFFSYSTPVEIEIKGFINEMSLKNPQNITLDDSETFESVLEKDIRKLYYPASVYLARTYKKARRGFLMRTVYLLKFFGRYYEITQICPIFGDGGIICNQANLYVCGANYDPFNRIVLPNEM